MVSANVSAAPKLWPNLIVSVRPKSASKLLFSGVPKTFDLGQAEAASETNRRSISHSQIATETSNLGSVAT